MKIIELEETNSTNEYCKSLNIDDDVIVIAKRQTAGKGTKGRSFSSLDGGIYLSLMRNMFDFPAEKAFQIMINSCVAVCVTLESFGISPVIRWANDVLVNGKKICGTLIENTFSGDKIIRSIVGCGLNVNNSFPSELKDIATSMQQAAGKPFDVKRVEKEFIKNLQQNYTVADYKSYMNWLLKPVTLKTYHSEKVVTALDISSDGRLIVDDNGTILKISSAEVSIGL
ncbi:MAG: biotin--[acetyl-CoA-carboxylase] ligase [Clostridia bacterium]|nr:biotin--[acetyl-CoA-carboxylase] ligase [Clostridia bacterium]